MSFSASQLVVVIINVDDHHLAKYEDELMRALDRFNRWLFKPCENTLHNKTVFFGDARIEKVE